MTTNAVNKQKNDAEIEVKQREAAVKEAAERREQELHPHRVEEQRMKNVSTRVNMAEDVGDLAGGAYRFNKNRWGLSGVAGLANDMSYYTKTKEAMTNLLKQANTSQGSKGKHVIGPNSSANYIIQDDATGLKLGINAEINDFKAGIYAYNFIPTISPQAGKGSVTAVAVRKFNTRVRGTNSGSTNYDSIDLFEYPLATDSIVMILAWCEKCISVLNFKETRDLATYSDQLLFRCCFDNTLVASAFRNRTEAIINAMNKAITDLEELNIPFELDYIKRHAWLTKSIFKWCEGYSKRYAIFNPVIYRYMEESTGTIKSVKFLRKLVLGATTVDDVVQNLRDIFNQMISPLIDSQAYATMSGDIFKAFGFKTGTLSKYPLNLAEVSAPAFVTDVKYLQSIKNAFIVSIAQAGNTTTDLSHISDFDIKQDIDALGNPFLYMGVKVGDHYFGPRLSPVNGLTVKYTYNDESALVFDEATQVKLMDNKQYSLYIDYYDYLNISEEDVLYNTRFIAQFKLDTATDTQYLTECGSEILCWGSVYWFDPLSVAAYSGDAHDIDSISIRQLETSDPSDYDDLSTLFLDPEDAHKFDTLGREHFVPKMLLTVVINNTTYAHTKDEVLEAFKWNGQPHYGDGAIYRFIWNRNNNRNQMDQDIYEQIMHEAMVNIFIMPGFNGNKSKRGNSK